MYKILIFLEHLSLREKILFYVFVMLFGFFLAFQSYEGFLKKFFDEIHSFDESDLALKKEQIHTLGVQNEKLDLLLEKQQRDLRAFLQTKQSFNFKSGEYQKELKSLSLNHKISLEILENNFFNDLFFTRYEMYLQVKGDFYSLIYFLKDLENSKFIFKLQSFEFQNLTNYDLTLNLKLSFIVIE